LDRRLYHLLPARPAALDEPDVPRAQYEAEMARREQEDPYPDWETRPDLELPPLGVDSYKISCAMRHYVPPAPAPKPKKVEPVDSPDQVALDDDIQF
jgi:hypothetical protein